MKYEWNKPFNLVIKIKKEYLKRGGDFDNYIFEEWISFLNKPEYNDFVEPVQINQHKEFILIRYGIAEMQQAMWTDENSIYRQCRSLVIDLKREEIVLANPRKFFNLDEVEENKIEIITEKIRNAKVVEFSNKLDGSMQSFRWYNNGLFGAGSMSLSIDNSWRLKDGFNMLSENHIKMFKDYPNYTFMFEYISLKDSHVVIYGESYIGLHLIMMINNTNGIESDYSDVEFIGKKYDIKYVENENITLDKVLELSKTYKSNEKEGWVLNIDKHRIKIKCDDYVKLHRMLDKLSSVNLIIETIADNKLDDLISKIPENYRDKILDLTNKIYSFINQREININEWYNKAPKQDRKKFMIWVSKNVPQEIIHYVRYKYLGKEYNLLKSSNGAYKKIKEILGKDYQLNVMEV